MAVVLLGAVAGLVCLALLILVSLLVSLRYPRWRHDLYVKSPSRREKRAAERATYIRTLTRAERRSATRAAGKVSPPL